MPSVWSASGCRDPRSTASSGARRARPADRLPGVWPRLLRPRLDDPGHDPAVLADLAVTGEPELLVGRQGAVEEEPGGHRPGVLGVSLDGAPAQACDEIERTGERRRGHSLAPVPLPGVAARDAP